MKTMTGRRALLLGAGAAGLAAAGAGLALTSGPRAAAPVGPIDPSKIAPLGDGYFLVDGWVLTEEDVNGLGVERPVSASD